MLFVRTLTGHTVELPDVDRRTFPDIRESLVALGIPAAEAGRVILSTHPFETEAVGTSPIVSAEPQPEIPKTPTYDSFPDSEGPPKRIATGPLQAFNLQIDDGPGKGSYINSSATSWQYGAISFDPPVPQFRLVLDRLWRAVFPTPIRLDGRQKYDYEVRIKNGMSTTNTETISAEIGVSVKGLSARVSRTLSKSITISSERETTEQFHFTVDDGETIVWTLWQLVDRFGVVDADGNPAVYSGRMNFQGGLLIGYAPVSLPTNEVVHGAEHASVPVKFHVPKS
jgi:hypothetical protein